MLFSGYFFSRKDSDGENNCSSNRSDLVVSSGVHEFMDEEKAEPTGKLMIAFEEDEHHVKVVSIRNGRCRGFPEGYLCSSRPSFLVSDSIICDRCNNRSSAFHKKRCLTGEIIRQGKTYQKDYFRKAIKYIQDSIEHLKDRKETERKRVKRTMEL